MRVRITDNAGNRISTLSLNVTVTLVTVSLPPLAIPRAAAVLNATSGTVFTLPASSTGSVNISGLSVDKVGTYLLRATVTGSYVNASGNVVTVNISADSANFNVTIGSAVRHQFITQPSNGSAGDFLPTQPLVAILDAGATSFLCILMPICTPHH